MRMTEFLSPPMIKVPLEGKDKDAILSELVYLACEGEQASVIEHVLQSVLERERLMSSGIGSGIALAHGFSPPEITFTVALGVTAEPVPFDAIDSQPVRLVFLLVSNEQHLNTKMKALARISRLLHREAFRQALATSSSSDEAMQVIVEEEARHRI